jgi:argininosuccinate lyase
MKLWGGRFTEETDHLVEQYTASISFDQRLAEVDVEGSIAHAKMLGRTGIILEAEASILCNGLATLLEEIKAGRAEFRSEDEDIHMNIERLLHSVVGPVAGKLHTGRSRNDQVALDMHMYLLGAGQAVLDAIRGLQGSILLAAERYMDVIIPGYTHLQRAQPVRLAHHLLAYFWMMERDRGRFVDVLQRTDMMPLGAGALAGTSFPIDRDMVKEQLGFTHLYENSLDAVSDRDYIIEFMSAASILMMHLSRFSEELILWTSAEFGWVELSDAFCTGSSMMPQKKNPDVPELVRGKTGRVYGHLLALLTVMKGLPLAYNKDLQEDKEGVFDTIDTLLPALRLFSGMIDTMQVKTERLEMLFDRDFSGATDIADYLAKKGLPFREAHEVVGQLVRTAMERACTLNDLPLEVFQAHSPLFESGICDVIAPRYVADAREVRGGTGRKAVSAQWELASVCLSAPTKAGGPYSHPNLKKS